MLCDTNVTRVFVAGDASRDAQFRSSPPPRA
jgi:hypothetical protein